MEEAAVILCGANAYEQKYYFNEKFAKLPESVKEELHIMCVLFTEEVGGTFMIGFDDEGHVIYMFVHAGLEANGTLLVNKTFEYDSFTNICKIKVSKSYTQSGVDAYYIGKNEFYWGDYKNGLFYGQYSEVYNGTEKGALYSFNNIGFSYSSHTIVLQNATTYRIEESDWSTIQDESTVALGVFYRIQECSEYAEEKFQEYNFGIHLF